MLYLLLVGLHYVEQPGWAAAKMGLVFLRFNFRVYARHDVAGLCHTAARNGALLEAPSDSAEHELPPLFGRWLSQWGFRAR